MPKKRGKAPMVERSRLGSTDWTVLPITRQKDATSNGEGAVVEQALIVRSLAAEEVSVERKGRRIAEPSCDPAPEIIQSL